MSLIHHISFFSSLHDLLSYPLPIPRTPIPPHPRSFISESSSVRARSPHSRAHGGLVALLNYFKYGIAGKVYIVLFLTDFFLNSVKENSFVRCSDLMLFCNDSLLKLHLF